MIHGNLDPPASHLEAVLTPAEVMALKQWLVHGHTKQLVTLLQVSEACGKSKQCLKNYSHDPKFPKPLNPERRKGQAAYYDWLEVRVFLLERTGVDYPRQFASLFLA